jgi:regulator of sigma E protease
LLAIVVFWIFFLGGEQRIQPIVGEPIKQSIAEEAGFQDGMRVLRIQDKSIESWTDINRSLFDLIGYSGNLKFSIESTADLGNQEILIPVTSWLSEEEEPFPARDLGLIPKLNYDGVQIISTESNGIAAASGLMEGDRLIGVNGISTLSMESFISEVKSNPNVPITIDYERKNIKESVELIPEMVTKNEKEIGAIGVVLSPIISYPDYMNKTLRYNLLTAIPRALAETRQSCVFVISSLRKLIMGDISPKNLSGPIGIAKVAEESARSGVFIFIRFIAILSIMLGIMNLLPVPILDGGQALFIMYEMIKGQPVPELVQSFSYRLGVFILLGLMFYATFNDISRFIR